MTSIKQLAVILQRRHTDLYILAESMSQSFTYCTYEQYTTYIDCLLSGCYGEGIFELVECLLWVNTGHSTLC